MIEFLARCFVFAIISAHGQFDRARFFVSIPQGYNSNTQRAIAIRGVSIVSVVTRCNYCSVL